MGSNETDKSAKDPKTPTTPPPSSQEQTSGISMGAVHPEWPGYQAYSPMPPPGFMASSPQGHPYMWGVQHIMPPPYGTPPPHPYMAMYPHGVYAHPSMPPGTYPFSPYPIPSANGVAEAPSNAPGSAEAGGKMTEGKKKLPIKRSKGTLGSLNMITGKNNGQDKMTGPSSNGTHSKSGESASDGSSQGSDANSQSDSGMKSGGRQDSVEANGSQNESPAHGPRSGLSNPPHTINATMSIMPIPAAAPAAIAGPTTNLNIGMDYWGAAAAAAPAMHGKVSPTAVATGIVATGTRDSLQSQLWLQDERELKKQRRKQSNRESARRSRLRKQAECDELAQQAEALKDDNANLRSELNRIKSEYERIVAENKLLKDKTRDNDCEGKRPEKIQKKLTDDDAQQPTEITDLMESGQ